MSALFAWNHLKLMMSISSHAPVDTRSADFAGTALGRMKMDCVQHAESNIQKIQRSSSL